MAEIRSPFFVYRLDFKNGLRAESWENRLTGTKLSLGGGLEVEADAGLPSGPIKTVRWLPAATRIKSETEGEIVFELQSEDPRLSATVAYNWDSKQPVLRKFTQIRNDSGQTINRLLNVRLGDYAPADGGTLAGGAERGFPAYIGDEFFATLAHPAGFSKVENGHVVLRQHPGARLAPGESFACMEAVLGVSAKGKARNSFTEYVRSRMRRVRRNHDKPFALLESFGGQPGGDYWTTEQYLLDHLAKVDQGIREGGPRFDFYCTEFWHDPAGDLTTFHRKNFPNGFAKVRDEILRLGMRPGLWIDSGGLPDWTIKDNPAIRGCFTKGDGRGEICRASEPVNSIYKQGFIQQVRENKVGLLKFDNLGPACQTPCCDNPAHGHLPGPIYSVEAIHNAVIGFLTELDAACPDVFTMLYWGYRSPWWLLHADTYFECGAHIEAASPASDPAPFARDSVTRRLDEGQTLIIDTPWLGKDSLGVWLSDWPWNSSIGKARWQEGFIMDLCRGSLLAQIWTDTNWLTPAERRQLAEFIELLRASPDCFGHSRPILGNPSKGEPYGYACGNGRRTFLAIHNAALKDSLVTLPLGPACGLPANSQWDIYRWHPSPARLTNSHRLPHRELQIALRPYQVVLLEIVPAGEPPSLKREFNQAPMPLAFPEPSRPLDLKSIPQTAQPDASTQWRVLEPISASAGKARLTLRDDGSILAGGEIADGDTYTIVAQTGLPEITAVMLEALTDDSLPSRGPGRAENGNFALTSLRLFAAPQDKPEANDGDQIPDRSRRFLANHAWRLAGHRGDRR